MKPWRPVLILCLAVALLPGAASASRPRPQTPKRIGVQAESTPVAMTLQRAIVNPA